MYPVVDISLVFFFILLSNSLIISSLLTPLVLDIFFFLCFFDLITFFSTKIATGLLFFFAKLISLEIFGKLLLDLIIKNFIPNSLSKFLVIFPFSHYVEAHQGLQMVNLSILLLIIVELSRSLDVKLKPKD